MAGKTWKKYTTPLGHTLKQQRRRTTAPRAFLGCVCLSVGLYTDLGVATKSASWVIEKVDSTVRSVYV